MIAIFALGPAELLIILFIALLIFGNRLPALMRSAGSSVNEFKKGLNDVGEVQAPAQPAPPLVAQQAVAAPAPLQPEQVPASKQLP
jgi:sec-independent protein translocase protein TatA